MTNELPPYEIQEKQGQLRIVFPSKVWENPGTFIKIFEKYYGNVPPKFMYKSLTTQTIKEFEHKVIEILVHLCNNNWITYSSSNNKWRAKDLSILSESNKFPKVQDMPSSQKPPKDLKILGEVANIQVRALKNEVALETPHKLIMIFTLDECKQLKFLLEEAIKELSPSSVIEDLLL